MPEKDSQIFHIPVINYGSVLMREPFLESVTDKKFQAREGTLAEMHTRKNSSATDTHYQPRFLRLVRLDFAGSSISANRSPGDTPSARQIFSRVISVAL